MNVNLLPLKMLLYTGFGELLISFAFTFHLLHICMLGRGLNVRSLSIAFDQKWRWWWTTMACITLHNWPTCVGSFTRISERRSHSTGMPMPVMGKRRSMWLTVVLSCILPFLGNMVWMYEYMILMMPKKNQTRLLQRLSIASRLIQGCFNKQSPASRLTQDQALPQNKVFSRHPRLW